MSMTVTSRTRSLCAYFSSADQTLTESGSADELIESNAVALKVAPEIALPYLRHTALTVTVWRGGLHSQEGNPTRRGRAGHTPGGAGGGRVGVPWHVRDGHPVDARVTR